MPERPDRLVAHTPNDAGEWHWLDDHSLEVARLASEFAAPFGAQEVARWLGLLHDAGKAHPDFQEYLWKNAVEPKKKHRTVDHKMAGAFLLQSASDLPQVLLGHHGGLSNRGSVNGRVNGANTNASQRDRLMLAWERFQSLGIPFPEPPKPTPVWARASKCSQEFYLRMLFSCLVDADSLDTEAHGNRHAAERRGLETPSVEELWERFEADHAAMIARVANTREATSAVNIVRAEVYASCITHAAGAPGLYRLTVPTGGGKTRASSAFALRHALHHGLCRVIYALPFLTITDQTADVLRSAFDLDRAVLEHHSGIEPSAESDEGEETPDERWRQLTSDNWDAPVVVTTTVQLFESLLGRKTRQCRKLHNIARSVLVLDEFQTIPAHLRATIFDVLRELVAHYGVTVVLCTATQPVLDTIETELERAGMTVTELAPDPERAFAVLDRVDYSWPDGDTPWTWDRVAEEIAEAEQSLTIVNTVRHASTLYAALGDPDAFHLSTRLCGAHRREVLRTIRQRLKDGTPCRVVSTQLVEAGVDLDFPLVLRAMGPLDRIVQAAGRCNREGKLPDKGRVVVFTPEDDAMPGDAYRHGTDVTLGLLREGLIDVTDPAMFDIYFRRLFADREADRCKVQHHRAEREYEEVADRFRMIDDDTFPLVVPYGGWETAKHGLLDAANRRGGDLKRAFRAIQSFIVTCRHYERERFEHAGLIEELRPGLWEWKGTYDDTLGIVVPERGDTAALRLDPARLIL